MANEQKPTVGRIVHYYYRQRHDSLNAPMPIEGPFAALIVQVDPHPIQEGWVVLRIFSPHNTRDDQRGAPYSEADPPVGNTWRWPPRA